MGRRNKKKAEEQALSTQIVPESSFDGKLIGFILLGFLVEFVLGLFAAAGLFFAALIIFAVSTASTPIMAVGTIVAFVVLYMFSLFGGAWACVLSLRWEMSHTRINSTRLKFTATAKNCAWVSFKWAFLTTITFGIYGLWVLIERKKWIVEHTEFDYDRTNAENAGQLQYAPSALPECLP